MEGNEPLILNASDLRQYVYCPRVIYYRYCLPVRPPPTYKMVEGKLQHEQTEELEHRRSLRAYGLTDGERVFDVRLRSDGLGVCGAMDLVILRRHEVIPVEFKHAESRPPVLRLRPATRPLAEEDRADGLRLGLHHKYQLAAYALLAEERWQLPARRCFVYFVPAQRAVEVSVTDGVRRYVRRLLREMREMIVSQKVPEGTRRLGRCQECEYRRFCNDVDV